MKMFYRAVSMRSLSKESLDFHEQNFNFIPLSVHLILQYGSRRVEFHSRPEIRNFRSSLRFRITYTRWKVFNNSCFNRLSAKLSDLNKLRKIFKIRYFCIKLNKY